MGRALRTADITAGEMWDSSPDPGDRARAGVPMDSLSPRVAERIEGSRPLPADPDEGTLLWLVVGRFPEGSIGGREMNRPGRKRGRFFDNPWFLRALGLAAILAVWQWYFTGGRVNPILGAPPTKVVTAVWSVITGPDYAGAVISTLELFFVGFLISAVLGILLGFVVARVRVLDEMFSPYLFALYASPLPALVPIITAVLGFTMRSKLLIVVLLGTFPVLINAQQGAKEVDQTVLEVARSFRASKRRLWIDVILPSSVPFLVVGLRLGAARAMIGTVVAELYTSPQGLGYQITKYGMRFDMDSMFVIVLTFTAMSLILGGMLRLLERRVAPWRIAQ